MMKRVLSLILALVMVFALCACGAAPEEESAKPKADEKTTKEKTAAAGAGSPLDAKTTEPGTLVVGAYAYSIENFDFSVSRNAVGIGLVFDPLVAYEWVDGERGVKPNLADSYEFTEEDGEWTLHFHLRDGIHFQNGDPIRASDVIFTYKTLLSSGFSGSYAAIDIENSYTDGDQDVYFKLFYYDAGLLSVMCEYIAGIYSEDWYTNATEDDMWNSPNGSGPFTLVEMVSGSHMKFAVDDNYWGWGVVAERPAYDYILVNVYSDASTMYIDYEMDKLDVCLSPAPADLERAMEEADESSVIRTVPGLKFRFLALPEYFEPFRNENVRKAIRKAIDVDAVVEAAYGSTGTAATAFMPAGTVYRVEYDLNDYDPEGARALLAEAGYSDGDIVINFVTDQDAQCLTMAEVIQAYLADVGITMNIESYETSVAIPMYRNGECDMFICMTSTNGYPSSVYMNIAESTSTMKGIMLTDPELNALLDAGAGETDAAKAQSIYEEVQQWQYDNCFGIPLYEIQWSFIYRDYVDGENVNAACAQGVFDLRNFDFVTE